ncbi:MAG: hypothetical protein ACK6AT_18595 [Planctomycetota bacterium]
MNVALRPEASSDLVSAAAYFNDISDGWGDHFLNTIEVVPFAIYYRVETESAIVYAILSCRMSPDGHRSVLERRM